MKIRIVQGVVCAAALVAVGCGEVSQAAQDPDALLGRWFQAESLEVDGAELPESNELTLSVREDGTTATIIGWSGCNGAGGEFEVDATYMDPVPDEDGVVRIGSTLKACPGPLGDVDNAVYDMFVEGPTWELDGDRLTVSHGDTTLELVETDAPDDDGPIVDDGSGEESNVDLP